jgi:hypothetical protein
VIWVVDVWLLYTASGDEKQGSTLMSRRFLDHMLRHGRLARSADIHRAYAASLSDRRSFAAIWYAKMCRARIYDVFEPEDEACARIRALLSGEAEGGPEDFHVDDICYVVLACRTPDRHLISGDTGDGDFCSSCTEWLHANLGVCFHDLAGEEPFHRARHDCTAQHG